MKQSEMKVRGHKGHEKEALWLQSVLCLPGDPAGWHSRAEVNVTLG